MTDLINQIRLRAILIHCRAQLAILRREPNPPLWAVVAERLSRGPATRRAGRMFESA